MRAPLLGVLALAGCATAPATSVPPAAPAPSADAAQEHLKGFQFLYGSGEGSALTLSAFHALLAYVETKVAKRPVDSVIISGAALTKASFVPCGQKPLAVLFDIDETVLWNLGFEERAARGEAYDRDRWARWEKYGDDKVLAAPGAVHAVTDLRKMGVTVVFNSNRNAATADKTIAALRDAKLGDAEHGRTLFLKGDDGAGDAKDGRRATIAARYCVVAMAGDQLGDFSDLFNAQTFTDRRALARHSSAGGLWGKGWFVLPNTVYGSALKGSVDEIFPDRHWADDEEPK